MLRLEADFAATDDHLARHLQLNYRVERLNDALQQMVERISLGEVARITVQDEAGLRVVLGQPILQHAQQDVVGYQLAGIHDRLGLQSHRRARRNGGAQHVAGRDMRHTQFRLQPGGLRAFARAGRTK
jgi:hypothetical protein